MRRLTIYLEGTDPCGWMVHDTDPEVRDLFGTDTLPTPFLEGTPAAEVAAVLRMLNPGAEVVIGTKPSQ